MLVINFKAYTDGDWGLNSELLTNHISRYFEQDYYEYTILDDEVYEFRRTYTDDELTDAVNFLTNLRNSLYGRDYETDVIKEYFNTVIDAINDAISNNTYNVFVDSDTGEKLAQFTCSMYSNTELEFYGGFFDANIKKIKHIDYE